MERSASPGRGWARFLLLLALALPPVCRAELTIDTDFAGGAADIVSVDQARALITFKIPRQKNGGWQSWWYLKVSGIQPGQVLTLNLLNGSAAAGRAVWSTDQKTWQFTQPVARGERPLGGLYQQKIDAPQAWFAWYIPYLPDNAAALAREAVKHPFAKVFDLCRSEEDRPVLALRILEGDARPDRAGVWIQARQHAWETGGSWTADGLARWLLSDDPRARRLRQIADITIVPIMDVDSVAGGRGGKSQRPHDHNRDWIEKPVWASVIAALQILREMDRTGRLDLFLDLHDPDWPGKVEFWCHTYPTQTPTRKLNTELFADACRQEITGPLAFDGKIIARYPLSTPTSGIWASSKTSDKVVGGTFEIGVAPPKGCTDAPPAYHHTLGQQLGLGIERYLSAPARKKAASD